MQDPFPLRRAISTRGGVARVGMVAGHFRLHAIQNLHVPSGMDTRTASA